MLVQPRTRWKSMHKTCLFGFNSWPEFASRVHLGFLPPHVVDALQVRMSWGVRLRHRAQAERSREGDAERECLFPREGRGDWERMGRLVLLWGRRLWGGEWEGDVTLLRLPSNLPLPRGRFGSSENWSWGMECCMV